MLRNSSALQLRRELNYVQSVLRKQMREHLHFAATENPVSDMEKAILWLKDRKQPITRKSLARVTPYTVVQIAGIMDREEHLKLFFNQARTAAAAH